ncbi:homeobox protein extradenticle-like [Mytilus californianus]|uniref:homeobox protein extradenticle-like n=1 Tax=Mytilus californianus TaxID=6549 RepID=UPI0022480EEE|nr:homeobox protein extradenticle-like [Mytilus californianus]
MSPIVGASIFDIRSEEIGSISSTPDKTDFTSSRPNTRRRLLSDHDQIIQPQNNDHGIMEVYLHRLQSNPMFEELSKILADECLHMQTPTNLINVSWEPTANQGRSRNIHKAHLNLQKKFLQFRSQERFQVAALEIESSYSKEVSKMEIDRYVELSLAMSPQHSKSVHENFDCKRLRLISEINNDLDALLLNKNAQTKRRSHDTASPLSDHQSDSGLSSADDNSNTDLHAKFEQSTIDVLGLAMAAAEVMPDIADLKNHNFDSGFREIPSLLETFPEPRQDIVHCQQTTQFPVEQFETQSSRLSLKRKLETSNDQISPGVIIPKKAKSEQVKSKSRQITPETTRILTEWYDKHVQYPYPTEEDVEYLIELTNISAPQVKKWMANKRVRCFNTLSITGNKHPIKTKLGGKRKNPESSNNYKQLNDKSRKILSDWYDFHIYNPYPTETEKEQLASIAGITVAQVKSWFANRRSRASNRKRQVPNYFLEKFPEYSSHVQMIQVHRDQTRRRLRPEPAIDMQQNYHF